LGSFAAILAAARLTSACACSSDTPGLRRAYAVLLPLPGFGLGGEGSSGIHTSVLPRLPSVTIGSRNSGGITPLIV
jgi:hypothetical protein